MDQMQEMIVKTMLDKVWDKTTSGIKEATQKSWEIFKTNFKFVFSAYLRNSYEKYSKIKTLIYRTEPQPLLGEKGFYEKPYIKKAGKEYAKKTLVEGLESIIELRTNYVMIEGEGGIGKSTLMKALFLSALKDKGYIPVFVELKEINNIENDYELTDVFFDKLYTMGSTLDPCLMDRTLSQSIYVFMLDGYDEIVSEKRSIFRDKLEKFIDMYPDNMYILSSRPFSNFIELSRFTIMSVCPFTKEQAISQIKKTKLDNAVKERFMQALEKELYDNHRDFASNPLLLNIMLLTYENYGNIPDNLHNFFAEAFDTMLQKHDATKGIFKRELKSMLSNDRFKEIFSEFCFYTYCMGKTEFSISEIKKLLSQIDNTLIVDGYLYDLQNALCVIIQDGTRYVFSHRSFQEYFTAYYLEKQNDEIMEKYGMGLIKRNVDVIISDNVFRMLSEMNKKRFDKNIVLSVFQEIEGKEVKEQDVYDYYLRLLCSVLIIKNKSISYVNVKSDPEWELELEPLRRNADIRILLLKSMLCPEGWYFVNWKQTYNNEYIKSINKSFIYDWLALTDTNFYVDTYQTIDYELLCSNEWTLRKFKKSFYGLMLNRIIEYRREILDRNKELNCIFEDILGFEF